MQKFTQIEDFRENLDIEICATLERDFRIADIEITYPNGETATQEELDTITPTEWEQIEAAIQDAEVYTGY